MGMVFSHHGLSGEVKKPEKAGRERFGNFIGWRTISLMGLRLCSIGGKSLSWRILRARSLGFDRRILSRKQFEPMHRADMHRGDTEARLKLHHAIQRVDWKMESPSWARSSRLVSSSRRKGLFFSHLKLLFYELIQPFLTSRVCTLRFRSHFTRGGNHFHRDIAEVGAIR